MKWAVLFVVLTAAVGGTVFIVNQPNDPIEPILNDTAENMEAILNQSQAKEPTPTPNVEIKQPAGSGKVTDQQSTSLNETLIALYIAEFTNDEREQRGLAKLTFDTKLAAIARYHSRDMARNDYYAHDSPDGETMSDRYQQFNYNCRVPTDGNRYYSGAENIAYTYHHRDVKESDGDTVYLSTEREIARSLVEQWMNSPPHRKNILMEEWDDIGVGIAIDGDQVYATQNFC